MDISCLDPCKHLEFFGPLVIFVMKPPRLRCQTESRYVQTVPDGKCLCLGPLTWLFGIKSKLRVGFCNVLTHAPILALGVVCESVRDVFVVDPGLDTDSDAVVVEVPLLHPIFEVRKGVCVALGRHALVWNWVKTSKNFKKLIFINKCFMLPKLPILSTPLFDGGREVLSHTLMLNGNKSVFRRMIGES